jgi:hypothetical protein
LITNYQKGIEMIWTRRILQGHSTESVALGIEACKIFKDVTGADLALWSPLGGMPYNALAWTQTAEDFNEAVERGFKCGASDAWMHLMQRASGTATTIPELPDNIYNFHAISSNFTPHAVGTVVMGSSITMKDGADYLGAQKYMTEWCEVASSATGAGVIVSVPMFGVNGTIEVSNFYPNAKAADAGRAAGMASAALMGKFMEGGAFFNANMNRTAIIRIA